MGCKMKQISIMFTAALVIFTLIPLGTAEEDGTQKDFVSMSAVKWSTSLEKALVRAADETKLVLWIELLGKLDAIC